VPKKQPQLAKLSRPRLHKPVARERLFRLLDEKREHSVVWIVGPPGAGKTTLAASYLDEADVPAIWFQVDQGDSDPGAFFYYLKQAIEAASTSHDKPLPLLTSEYLPDLPAFARQFLRDGFSRLPDDVVLVLDNYQELAESSALHAAIEAAIHEVPLGANVLAISRANPPGTYAHALVNRLLSVLDWADLQLTPEETGLVAARGGITDERTLRDLHARSGGWMAGLTLMLESVRNKGAAEAQGGPETLDTLFDYFANLIFQDASASTQEILLKTSFLPWVDRHLAAAATGIPDAVRQVEDLHRRHLFTDRRAGAEATYQYHALFRDFLQSRAIAILPPAIRKALQSRIGAELNSAGHAEEAFRLLVDAQDWAAAEKVLLNAASSLAHQGRWLTLAQWVGRLPGARIAMNPWLSYWQGRSATYLEPSAAIPMLEVAYRIFVDRGDEVGQLLAATTLLEGIYFSFENLKPMDPWIERLTGLLQRGIRAPTKEDELRANSAVMVGATLRAPMHSMLPVCLQRVFELLKEPFEPNLKVSAASMLQGYSNVAMDVDAERIAVATARPLLGSKELSPIRALFYWTAEGYSHYVRGRHAEALACFDAGDAIVEWHQMRDVNVVSPGHGRALCERRAGLLEQAEATALRAENVPMASTGHHRGRLWLMKSVIAFDRGKVQQAIEDGLKAYRIYDDAGFFNGVITVGTVVANMAIVGGRFDIADAVLDRLRGEAYGAIAQNYVASVVLNQAWLEHRRGAAELRNQLLRSALQRTSEEGARVRFHWYQNAMSELLPVAISMGIEPDAAISLARQFFVRPVPMDVERWPWPVKVHVLGQFSLSIDGRLPDYSRKLPKKVLALLKAIIAFGGNEVPEQKIMAALWPDEDGDSAHRSLTATLHRLRKLMGTPKAIRQAGGELSVEEEVCWVDAVAFDRRLALDLADAGQLEHAIDLYRGAFLPQDEDAPWAVPMRERLRSKFILALTRRASIAEAEGRHEQAVSLYLRGIDADSLVEAFYQGLMRCYDRMNRRTEAVSVYRRLRDTLSITLGVQPSAASRRIFDSLRTN